MRQMHARGGRGGAEPAARIRRREARAWQLSVEGWTQRDIARELGVSQPAISNMLKRVGAQAWHELRADTSLHLTRTIHQLDHLYQESIRAWHHSKGDLTRRRQQRVETAYGTAGTSAVARTVVEATATVRDGDPRFLAIALQALRAKRAVLALVVPAPVLAEMSRCQESADQKAMLGDLSNDELALLNKLAEMRLGRQSAPCEPAPLLTMSVVARRPRMRP